MNNNIFCFHCQKFCDCNTSLFINYSVFHDANSHVSNKSMSSPFTPLRHTGGGEVKDHLFFTSVLDEGQCRSSLPGCFTPKKELRYKLKRRISWPHNQYGQFWRTENVLLLPRFQHQKSSQLLVATLTALVQNDT
jgi:hypothetical protein